MVPAGGIHAPPGTCSSFWFDDKSLVQNITQYHLHTHVWP